VNQPAAFTLESRLLGALPVINAFIDRLVDHLLHLRDLLSQVDQLAVEPVREALTPGHVPAS
jgi:hypothetical protein